MKEKYDYLIVLGVSFLLVGLFMIALQLIDSTIALSILVIGITIIVATIFRKRKLKSMPEKDERIKKLSMYGLGYSWITTFLIITIFFWFDYFELIKITTQQYYTIVSSTMIVSAIVFQRVLYKKGDVE